MKRILTSEKAQDIGLALKQMREEAGLSQRELAMSTSFNTSRISTRESGQGGSPKVNTLAKTAAALGFELVIEFRRRA